MAVFRRHWTYLSGPNAAQSLWRKLTPTQKQQVGGSLSAALSFYGRPAQIWMHLHPQISEPRAVVELAMKLFSIPVDEAEWILREMGELPMDAEAAREAAISRGDLVVLRTSQSVYWHGELQKIRWGRRHMIWDFFVTSCERAAAGLLIDRSCFEEKAYANVVSDRLYQLGKVPKFPDDLLALYEEAGRQTQRFNIPAHRVYLFND